MLHYGRCGSSVLCDLIGQHPSIYWDAEVFSNMFRKRLWETYFIQDPILLLRTRMLRAGWRYYGFETKCHPAYNLRETILNLSPSSYIHVLKELNYQYFIVLKRKNYLRQQLSEQICGVTGPAGWHQSVKQKPNLHQVALNVQCVGFGCKRVPLLASFEERDRVYSEFEHLLAGDRTLWLTYEEDIFSDPRLGYQRVCEFLGILPREVKVKRGRTNPFPLPDLIQNFAEVENCLRSTRYEWMLYD